MRRALVGILWCVACGDDGGPAVVPDAQPDAAPPTVECWANSADKIACDFTCAGVAFPTTAPDPLSHTGSVSEMLGPTIGGATVEVRDAATDAVLATATTNNGASMVGRFTASIATGGIAPTLYRKIVVSGHPDAYSYDATPAYDAARAANSFSVSPTQAKIDGFYASAFVSHSAGLSLVQLQIQDCAGHGVSGAQVTLEGATKVLYNSGSGAKIPDPSAAAIATDSTATAWIVDGPVGVLHPTITAGDMTYRDVALAGYADLYTYALRRP